MEYKDFKIVNGVLFDYTGNDEHVIIPNDVIEIEELAFCNHKDLLSITIPSSVKYIESDAFLHCRYLVEIYNLSSFRLDDYYFDSTVIIHTSLDEKTNIIKTKEGFVFIYDGCDYQLVKYIGTNNKVILPDNIMGRKFIIKKYAFYEFENLTSIIIPSAVKKIEDSAFSISNKLVEIYNYSALDIKKGSKDHGYVGYNAKVIHTKIEESNIIETKDGFLFINDGDNYYLFDYSGNKSKIVLPTDINGSKYLINDFAFYEYDFIESVVISRGVISIGKRAFSYCYDIKSIIIEEGVESIDDSAFLFCVKLTTITIPKSIKMINEYAFHRCFRLVEVCNLSSLDIKIGDENNGYVGYYAKVIYESLVESNIKIYNDYILFKEDNNYYLVGYFGNESELILPSHINNENYSINNYAFIYNEDLKKVIIPEGIISIGKGAFYGCNNLIFIGIPNSIKRIEEDTFAFCGSLKSIYIPKSVVHIEKNAFNNTNNLEYISVDLENPMYNSTDNCNAIIETASNRMIVGCNNTVIPNSVKIIEFGTFSNRNIELLHIPLTIEEFDTTFSFCTKLKEMKLPECLTIIQSHMFYYCLNLSNITIPKTVKEIDDWAFAACTNLKNIYFNGSEDDWNNIKIGCGNERLIFVDVYCYSKEIDNYVLINKNNENTIIESSISNLPIKTQDFIKYKGNRYIFKGTILAKRIDCYSNSKKYCLSLLVSNTDAINAVVVNKLFNEEEYDFYDNSFKRDLMIKVIGSIEYNRANRDIEILAEEIEIINDII